MQAEEEKTPKRFANRGRIERGEFEKLPFGSPDAIGNDGVAMRIKVAGPSYFHKRMRQMYPACLLWLSTPPGAIPASQ